NGAAVQVQGSGAKISCTARRFDQGTLVSTGRHLDLAISGEGFFRVVGEDGAIYYTRDGSLHIDSGGRITNSRGHLLLDDELPENHTDLVIDEKGNITYKDQEGARRELGQIELHIFANPAGLEPVGENMFAVTETSGAPENFTPGDENAGIIRQNYLESSNVDLVYETQTLIEAQRAFELNARSVNTADQLWSIANNLKK
ncbi:MAG: flagellar hook-basal body complex protein, partial [Firmicutes bacterium]|nr:flagellar hook-basal body complex protein [Bacillota bacterium]